MALPRNHHTLGYVFLGTAIFIVVFLYTLDTENNHLTSTQESFKNNAWHREYYGLHSYQNETMENVELEMRKRRWNIKRICHQLRRNFQGNRNVNYKHLDHVIVDDKYRLLYCYVPKVACTNWKRILMILKESSQTFNPLDIPANDSHRQNQFRTLDNYTHDEIQYRLRHYFKFVFVRHPFERLLSAFRNKFQQNYSVYFQQRFGRLIIQRHRINASEDSLSRGNDVTFSEFVDYLLDKRTISDGMFNEHWRSIYSLCHPCFIHYDAVGKYEDLDVDAQYVLQKANVQRLVRFPKINKTVDTLALISDYFKNLTSLHIQRLYHMFSLDFKMFGYKYSDLDIT